MRTEIENLVLFHNGRGCGGRGVCGSAAGAAEEVAAAAWATADFLLSIVSIS